MTDIAAEQALERMFRRLDENDTYLDWSDDRDIIRAAISASMVPEGFAVEVDDDGVMTVRSKTSNSAIVLNSMGNGVEGDILRELCDALLTTAPVPAVTKIVEYDLSPAMVEGAIRQKLIALGWKPPGAPDGFGQIPLDPCSGKPRVTNEMKSLHIGEYRFSVALGIGVDGEQTDINVTVPWDTCKAIYKGMARTAMVTAVPAPAPADDLAALRESLRDMEAQKERAHNREVSARLREGGGQ